MSEFLTELQKLKMDVVSKLNFDVEKAKQVMDFVIGDDEAKTVKVNQSLLDGVYYVLKSGKLESVGNFNNITDNIIGVAVKMGDKIATVALHDAAGGRKVSLVNDDYERIDGDGFYYDGFVDAICDWDGEDNTKRLSEFLNSQIILEDGQYIPSLAQLHLILLNIKDVDKALVKAGGDKMIDKWYWSSTENSANSSWHVNFTSGYSNGTNKYNELYVRPAVAISA